MSAAFLIVFRIEFSNLASSGNIYMLIRKMITPTAATAITSGLGKLIPEKEKIIASPI